MITVRLTPSEYHVGAYVGVRRRLDAILRERDRRATASFNSERWTNDIEGALGELAVCKHLGIYWDGRIGKPGDGDVGVVEVKTSPPGGRLIVQSYNRSDVPYILVYGYTGPEYSMIGWLWGHEAQEKPTWDPRGDAGKRPMPAHFVDSSELHEMSELPLKELGVRILTTRRWEAVR